MLKNFLEIGKIVSTHGLKGEVKVDPWCDSVEFLCKFKTLYFDSKGEKQVKVLSARTHKNQGILKFDGIDSIEKAELLRGKILYMNRNDCALEEGEHFVQDILGLEVCDKGSGFCYGTVTDILKTGANDVYQVTNEKGQDYLIPAVDEIICTIDFENSKIIVNPIEGMFDDEN